MRVLPVDDGGDEQAKKTGLNGHDTAPVELTPDRAELVSFVDTMFRNARPDSFVSFRVFTDNGRSERAALTQAVRLDDHEFVPLMLIKAEQAATWYEPAVFAPPVATFKNHLNAKTDNLAEGIAISAECDQAPREARATLEAILGPATIVVASGGEWMNPETGEIEPKLHLHWRLRKAAAGVEELARLYHARSLATKLVGGDNTNISIVHPIRWPGSWHRKKTPKLAKIIALNDETEIDLDEAVARLREAAEAAGIVEPARAANGAGVNGCGPHEAADQFLVASTLAVIPNGTDPKAHDWEYWNKIGMTIWASTSGSEVGRAAFHEWSSKSPKYDQATTDARWKHYFRSPPNRLSFGSLVYRAREADPEWRYQHPMNAPAEKAVGEFLAQLLRERDEADDDNAGPPRGAAGGAAPPLIEAKAFVLRDPKTLPQRQWLYGYHLIRKFGSATFAASGSGKTNLLIAEALAMATGRALLGIVPLARSRVWLWNGEDPMDELERRIGAACLHYGITPAEIDGWLFVNSGRDAGSKVVIATQDRNGVKIAVPVVDALIATIRANKIDVVMIDPFISSHQVTENDNNAIDAVAKTWTMIADITDTAIDLAHHTRKTGGAEVTVEDGRGAVALLNAVRPARVLNVMTADEAKKVGITDNRKRYFRVADGKNNLSLAADKVDWFRSATVGLSNGPGGGDQVGVVTPWQWPDPMDGVVGADFTKAAAIIRGAEWKKSSQASNWVGYAIAQALGLGDITQKGPDRTKALGLANIWLAMGALVVVRKEDPARREVKEYVEVPPDPEEE